MNLYKIYPIFCLLGIGISCSTGVDQEKGREKQLLSLRGRDTIVIDLIEYEESFYGKYRLKGPGNYVVTGEIQGSIQADTLIGDIFYTPYGWNNKKRRAFALLAKDGEYIEGSGIETIYMGIPHFTAASIDFDSLANTYQVLP